MVRSHFLLCAFFLASASPLGACESHKSPPATSEVAPPARSTEIQEGELIKELELSRHSRTASELASRAAGLANAITGTTLCTASDATSWAQEAVSSGFAAASPFSCSSNIRVQYDQGRDVLIVENTAQNAPLHETAIAARSATLGQLGASISKTQAVTKANDLLAQSDVEALLEHTTYPWEVSSIRGFVDGVSSPSVGTVSTIRTYGVNFRRAFEGIHLLDTMLEVRVDGETGRITGVVVADIELTVTGRQLTKIGSDTASQMMDDQLQDQAAMLGAASFTLRSEQAVYVLPSDLDSSDVFPVHHALATPLTSTGSPGHTLPVALPMVSTPGEDFSVQFLERRPSTPPTPAQDGGLCQTDSQCASGHCFVADDGLGYCGDCSGTTDCDRGSGCLPPKVLSESIRGSRCVALARGVLCEMDEDCSTGDLCTPLDPNTPDGHKTCGECIPGTGSCSSGTYCNLVITPSQVAYRECSPPAALGHVCDSDSGCASGHCVDVDFQSGRTVGVCSECTLDADCGASQNCSPPGITANIGFVGGTCQ